MAKHMHGLQRTTVLLCAEQQTTNAGVLTSPLPCNAGSTVSKHSVTKQGLQSKPCDIFGGQEITGNDFEDQRVLFFLVGMHTHMYTHMNFFFFFKSADRLNNQATERISGLENR